MMCVAHLTAISPNALTCSSVSFESTSTSSSNPCPPCAAELTFLMYLTFAIYHSPLYALLIAVNSFANTYSPDNL
jgi:hypothetical protein